MTRWIGVVALCPLLWVGCTGAQWVNRQTVALEETLVDMREQAMACAPKELAYIDAHIAFARHESAQGRMLSARDHVKESKGLLSIVVEKSEGSGCDGDRDGDGIVDSIDQCPDIPEDFDNEDDNDGCPEYDRDSDGIPDDRDQCPNRKEDKDRFQDQDGCPDPDNDGDGLLDQTDQCPNRAEDMDDFEDLDGCPEKDNDQDGLPDALDECPSRKGPESKKGCPDRFATIIVRANSIALRRPIQFRGKSAELHRRSRGVLREIVIALNKYPKLKLRIEGYASSKSSETANQRLARARASAVRAVLMSKGIARSRLDVDGFAVDTSTDGATPQERIEIHIDSE